MSFKRKATTTLMALMLLSLEAYSAPNGDFEDFYDGAIEVYASQIDPSIETSERFHRYLLKMYFNSRCNDSSQCFASGGSAATQFVNILKMGERNENL